MNGMGWIHLAEDRGQWQVLVNMVMNLGYLLNFGKLLAK
jgi:hypothetical protein